MQAALVPIRSGTRKIAAALALAFLLVGLIAHAEPLVVEGYVRVIDGDTIIVDGTRVRLQALHAPEMDELGGAEAKAFMQGLVAGRVTCCELTGEQTYNREVGRCYVDG